MLFIEYSTGSEKIKWLSGYRMVLSILVFYLQDNVADWELPLPNITREDHTTYHQSRGKNHNSKFKIQFLLDVYSSHNVIKFKILC